MLSKQNFDLHNMIYILSFRNISSILKNEKEKKKYILKKSKYYNIRLFSSYFNFNSN